MAAVDDAERVLDVFRAHDEHGDERRTLDALVAVLREGGDPNASFGGTLGSLPVLSWACSSTVNLGREVVRALLAAGAAVDAFSLGLPGGHNYNALQTAVYNPGRESVEVMKVLLKYGADVHLLTRTEEPEDALGIAMRKDNQPRRRIRLILHAGATISPQHLNIASDNYHREDWRGVLAANHDYLAAIHRTGGIDAFVAEQLRTLTVIVSRHVVGTRLPHELVEIIAKLWGHPGDYVVNK